MRERKLNKNEKPLSVQVINTVPALYSVNCDMQSHWGSHSPYQKFVLRRATRSVSAQVGRLVYLSG